PRQGIELALPEIARRQRRRDLRRERARVCDRGGVAVDAETGKAPAQEISKVPAGTASGVEDAGSAVEPSPQQLVEQIDGDLAELRAEIGARRGDRRAHGRRPASAALVAARSPDGSRGDASSRANSSQRLSADPRARDSTNAFTRSFPRL